MSWTINSKTAKTAFTDTDNLVIQEAAGTVKKLAMSVLRKIIPATDSTSAFRVTKANGTTDIFCVDTTNSRIGINTSSPGQALDVVGGAMQTKNYAASASIAIKRSNGTEASPSAIQSSEIIGALNFAGRGTSTDINSAVIRSVSEEIFTDATAATFLSFRTTPTGSVTNSESMRLTSSGAAYFPRIATTASAANAYLDSGTSNSLLRSTSSAKYKTDIKDLADSSVLDDLRPIVYKSNPETVPNDDPTKEHYGFIAEELDKVDSKLVHYIKDEDGKETPDGVQYERVVVLLVKRIQELEARLAKAGI